MKSLSPIALALCLPLLVSCASLALLPYDLEGWSNGTGLQLPVSLGMAEPTVHRAGDIASIRTEIKRLAPLLFMERGRPMDTSGAVPNCLVDIHAVEREYTLFWKTHRSVSVDVRILRDDGPSAIVAAGKISVSDGMSLASSRELRELLSAAVGTAVGKLRSAERSAAAAAAKAAAAERNAAAADAKASAAGSAGAGPRVAAAAAVAVADTPIASAAESAP